MPPPPVPWGLTRIQLLAIGAAFVTADVVLLSALLAMFPGGTGPGALDGILLSMVDTLPWMLAALLTWMLRSPSRSAMLWDAMHRDDMRFVRRMVSAWPLSITCAVAVLRTIDAAMVVSFFVASMAAPASGGARVFLIAFLVSGLQLGVMQLIEALAVALATLAACIWTLSRSRSTGAAIIAGGVAGCGTFGLLSLAAHSFGQSPTIPAYVTAEIVAPSVVIGLLLAVIRPYFRTNWRHLALSLVPAPRN